MFGQLGVHSFRATEVDLESMATQSAWSISDHGEFNCDPLDDGPNSAFLAAMDTGTELRNAPAEHTVVRKLSPRLWAFSWRLGPHRVVVAVARYREKRDVQTEIDIALVRLICLARMRVSRRDTESSSAKLPKLEWPAIDRRRDGNLPTAVRNHGLSLLLLVVSALAALWVALIAVPRARYVAEALQTDAARLQAMADKTMTNALSAALATGDYGEVQDALSSFQALGYFQGAVVTNARQRVVSIAGPVGDARIGGSLPETVTSAARLIALTQGSERHGQLVLFDTPTELAGDTNFRTLFAAALLGFLAASAAAVVLMAPRRWRLRPKSLIRD